MNLMSVVKKQNYLICLFALLAVCFSILIRSEPLYFSQEILRRYAIAPEIFLNLMTHYQYSLIATLLLAGCCVDYFGARIVLFCGLIAVLVSNIVFSFSHSAQLLVITRIIAGYAHPFILIGALKLGVENLTKHQLPLFIGTVFAVLLLTPQVLQPIIAAVFTATNYLVTLSCINLCGLIVIVGIYALNEERLTLNHREFFNYLWQIFKNKNIWLLSVVSLFGWLSNTFFLHWGALFIQDMYHLSNPVAVHIVKYSFVCFALSAIGMGLLADRFWQKQAIIGINYTIAAFVFLAIPFCSSNMIAYAFYAVAITTGSAVMCYVTVYDLSHHKNAGVAFGLLGCLTTIGNTYFAYYLGRMFLPLNLQLNPHETVTTWLPAIGLIPICLLLGALTISRIKPRGG